MITISVFHKSTGKPRKGARVVIGWAWGMSNDVYTDEDGDANFDHDSASGTVYVDGKNVKKGHLSGREIIYT